MAVNPVISWIVKKRIHQIGLFKTYPIEVQNELLMRMVKAARYTEWGKKYGYGDISSTKEFSQRFPVQRYEDLLPYIERMKNGEQNVLWHNEIKWFAKSSGTTSQRSKFIPVSLEALEECHYKGGKDLVSLYFHNYPKTEVLRGKTLVIAGSKTNINQKEDNYIGDLSAIITDNLPFWVEMRRTPSLHITLLDNWEEKIEKMALQTLKEDVRVLSGVPSWTLVILKRILDMTGKSSIRDVWPKLELFMHGGVNFSPYRKQFEQIIPGTMNYLESYNASEGYFGIEDRLNSDDLLLMLDYGIYYEFIPMEHFESENPPTFTLEEVEVGINYAVVITTNSGLWRYLIGDTIKFTATFPFRFVVSGRTKHFINAFGEEVIIDNAEKALAEACKITGAIINEFTAGPVYMQNDSTGAHEWLIEFEKQPDDLLRFRDALDQKLKEINSDYEAKRTNNFTLKPPIIRSLTKGTFYVWLKSKNKLGGQHKIPRLANSRWFINELSALINMEKIESVT
jgi:hypothetical protein